MAQTINNSRATTISIGLHVELNESVTDLDAVELNESVAVLLDADTVCSMHNSPNAPIFLGMRIVRDPVCPSARLAKVPSPCSGIRMSGISISIIYHKTGDGTTDSPPNVHRFIHIIARGALVVKNPSFFKVVAPE